MLFRIDEAYIKKRSQAPKTHHSSVQAPSKLTRPLSSRSTTATAKSTSLSPADESSTLSSSTFPLLGPTAASSPLATSVISLFTSAKTLMSNFQGLANAKSHLPSPTPTSSPTVATGRTMTQSPLPSKVPVSTAQITIDPARCSCCYKLGKREQLANVLTHLPWTFACMYGCWFLTSVSRNQDQLLCALIYGISFACAFGTSTIYHWCSYAGLCKGIVSVMQKLDRSLIYVVVAASFTPWLMLRDFEPASIALASHILVWVLAIVGILYEQFTPVQYKTFENLCYIVQIFLPLMCIFFLRDVSGLKEIFYGGLIYIVGFWFFKMDGVIPFAHAMWHVCCNLGSFIHFWTISKYLFTTTIA